MNATAVKQNLARELKQKGYHITVDRWPAKLTFYKKTGEAMPNLPADPWSMERYLKRGLTLTKPTEEQIATYIFGKHPELVELLPDVEPSDNGVKCEICGFEAKSDFGLKSHMRTHK